MRRKLTPLKKKPKPEPFAVCDIEAHRWNQFTVIGHFNGFDYRDFFTLEDFFEYIFQSGEGIIYAHFGGIYDFLFLLSFCLGSNDYFLDSFLPRGSGLLSITIGRGDRKIQFRDSSSLLPHSLEKLTKSFGVEHVKGTFDFDAINKLPTFPSELLPELRTYLEYDCRGLYEVLDKYRQNELVAKVGLKITRSAQALQVFRTYLKDDLPACPMGIDEIVRMAYAGGRTEIFRPLYESETEPLNTYDINSLYPSVLKDFDMPWGFDKLSDSTPNLERIGFGFFTIEVPEDNYLPILWTRESGKFIFPVGKFSGWFPLCEVKRAIEENRARIIKSGAVAYFHNGGKYFAEYVETLYEQRRQSNDPVERIIIKDLLNHLYGRMGLRLKREQLEFDNGDIGVKPFRYLTVGEKTYGIVKREIEIKSFSNVAIAAWVTARARLRLYDKILKPCERTIHYTDTDSGYTTQTLQISDGLGQLKLEGNCWNEETRKYEACFLLPKTYIAGNKIAFKGFPNRKVKHFKIDDFQTALDGDMRLMRIENEARGLNKFKTGLLKGDLLSKQGVTTKAIKSRYDKRIVFRDNSGKWETRPLVLGKGK